jgi:hypothetical protein
MIYVVNVRSFGGWTSESFSVFKPAFKAFREACKDRNADAALWHGSDLAGEWTKVYSTRGYPECLTRPHKAGKPHSFQHRGA